MNTSKHQLEEISGIKSFFNNFSTTSSFILNKNIPENFIVNEILPNKTVVEEKTFFCNEESGLFFHAILKKRLIDTPGAIKILSKALKIPSEWIGYAGLKDSKAITYQRISIFNTPLTKVQNLQFQNLSLHQLTRRKYEVNLGDLWGNRFQISMDPIEDGGSSKEKFKSIEKSLEKLKDSYFPNFYGLQRFGSTRPISHIVGKYLLKNDYENAAKVYLTSQSTFEPEKITELRKKLAEDWDYTFFINNLPRNYQYEILLSKSLSNFPNNFFRAINAIPNRMKKFFVSSYQSFIFNELLSEYIRTYNENTDIIKFLPLLTQKFDISSLPDSLGSHVEYLLNNDEISFDDFKKTAFSSKFKKEQYRSTFIKLTDFKYSLQKDQLLLEFSLPKSSYATMVIREIER